MKRLLALVLVLCLALVAAATGLAAPASDADIRLFANGSELQLTTKPVLRDGVSYVPVRGVFESLGGVVGWDAACGRVTIATADGILLSITAGGSRVSAD